MLTSKPIIDDLYDLSESLNATYATVYRLGLKYSNKAEIHASSSDECLLILLMVIPGSLEFSTLTAKGPIQKNK